MARQTQAQTVELETTMAANSDKMYAADACRDCGDERVLQIEINSARGQRKLVNVCYDCAQDIKNAPDGVYDPTVLAYHPESEYDGY